MKKNNQSIKLLSLLGLLSLGFITLAFGVVSWALQPVSNEIAESVRFIVPKGQAITIMGERLVEEGLIKHPLIFRAIVIKDGLSTKIQAGSFDISPDMSVSEIANHLTNGTQDTWVTILEGWRAEEISESLEAQDLDNFDKDEFLEFATSSEGMLYPDTYLIPREMSSEQIYHLLVNTFERKVSQGLWDEIEESDRDFDDVLIMSSLVEREARNFDQMRKVAGILWNRIDLGMALQVDATLQYSKGYDKYQQDWWSPPLSADKKVDSPYNTYLNPGLPPQPIANPSLNAITATLSPKESDDLFYIHANDGSMYTAATLEEHNANINKYLR